MMKKFNVTGMSCAACSSRVEKAVDVYNRQKFYNTTENKVGSQVLTAFDYGTNNNILQKVTYGNGQTVNCLLYTSRCV